MGNLVDLKAERMANIEVWEDRRSVFEVSERMGNYTHFNMYKHLELQNITDKIDASSVHRAAITDALPPPRTRADVMSILSDTTDPELPVFKNGTLATFILDGLTGQLDIWCNASANSGAPPAYSWNLWRFFSGSAASIHI